MKGQKMPLYEGEDGKLYFNFAVGLKVQLREERPGKEPEDYTLEITGCYYIGNTEYYDVKRDGLPLPQAQSANRVKYLLSMYGVRTLNAGKRFEVPLLLDEVKRYYEYHERRKEAAQRKLDSLPEYSAICAEINGLNIKLAFAEIRGERDKYGAENYKSDIAAFTRRKLEIEQANGMQADLDKLPRCELCGGKGHFGGVICSCAIKRAATIKAFNAEERRRLKRLAI